MSKKNNIPQVKNEEQYEALRDKWYSKQKAARIANTPDSGVRGAKAKLTKNAQKASFMRRLKRLVLKGEVK